MTIPVRLRPFRARLVNSYRIFRDLGLTRTQAAVNAWRMAMIGTPVDRMRARLGSALALINGMGWLYPIGLIAFLFGFSIALARAFWRCVDSKAATAVLFVLTFTLAVHDVYVGDTMNGVMWLALAAYLGARLALGLFAEDQP